MAFTRAELIEAAWHKAASGQGRGSLKFLLRKHQWPIYEAIWDCLEDPSPEHSSHVVNCSRQFGKSFTEIVISTEVCLAKGNRTVLFVAPYKSQAEEILTGKTYGTIFESCPPQFKPRLDGNNVQFPNGSRIRLNGTDNKNYEYLRGGAADVLILDEAGFMANLEFGVLPALQPMLQTTNGKTIISSTPPPNLDHHYTAIVHEHAERGHLSTFTIFENTSITPDALIKEYMNTGCQKQPDGTWKLSTRFRREFMAELIMEGTMMIAKDWNDEFIQDVQPNEFHEYHHRYVGMDPGVTDLNATLFGYYDHANELLFIQDELTHSGQTLNSDILSQDIKKTMTLHWADIKPYRMISDNNNKHLVQDLRSLYDLPFIGTTKTKLETRKANQEEGMVNKLNTWLRQGRILVHPRCRMLIGSLRHGIWREDGDNQRTFAQSKTYGHYDHLAALVYLVRNCDIHTNPVPRTHGFSSSNMFMPQVTRPEQSRNLERFANALAPHRR